jgi:hypothetical protein
MERRRVIGALIYACGFLHGAGGVLFAYGLYQLMFHPDGD